MHRSESVLSINENDIHEAMMDIASVNQIFGMHVRGIDDYELTDDDFNEIIADFKDNFFDESTWNEYLQALGDACLSFLVNHSIIKR